jgi:hypothetical protein
LVEITRRFLRRKGIQLCYEVVVRKSKTGIVIDVGVKKGKERKVVAFTG